LVEFYLDIEVDSDVSRGPDPKTDKIITIQFQPLGFDFEPERDLTILKEWESSEKEILGKFKEIAVDKWVKGNKWKWDFVPVGDNLLFDLSFILERMEKHGFGNYGSWFLARIPKKNFETVAVLVNYGRFKGYSELFTDSDYPIKNTDIPRLYKEGEYDTIVKYIEHEAEYTLQQFQRLGKQHACMKKELML